MIYTHAGVRNHKRSENSVFYIRLALLAFLVGEGCSVDVGQAGPCPVVMHHALENSGGPACVEPTWQL
jgi:hypothetical protein